ncbi:hypothetical protein [Pseudoalteromonas luteoviolacea]|uniref:HEXXH motif domain-containing protein n=1 Tax=Pseudoalteromonas luteoviolacea S4054 TaxID=1129367 RepID=A0A0F6A6Z7_9GAMM|nr:hypothetical protein [Pseudoalteromonas luteoviolacea]QYD01759.1 putative protease [synthetic construct]AOT10984.1 hypothetical protein S4054249_24410 [Pseudoalteromonas luteoviolacea]AOT15852.1 hypothetical protein S40542_24100 [Pseudoalteromonas luteoviolacea]AOT20805.1 hypothetical protein S4054_24330 [Pseudoalteromonas luteoviolacea]KKE81883.1 hypothetical protein N479_20835 [Pseudoalteromonas luteoviolacea S4054]
MHTLTNELPKCLEFNSDRFAGVFDQCKIDLLIDIFKREILSHKELSELFDKLSSSYSSEDLYTFFKLPKLWKVIFSSREKDDYFDNIKALFLAELKLSTINNVIISNSSLIEEQALIWNLRADIAYNPCTNIGYKNNYQHKEAGILIDYFSDLARGQQRDIPWGDTGLSQPLIDSTAPKVISAIDYIQSVSTACFNVLKASICSIVVRFDTSKNKFNCASTNICNGLVVLINPHLNEVSVETLADAIVHEMTHNLFDIAELYEPCLPTKFHSQSVKSPWTGRMLDPNTYIQACYTWYGLRNFWQKAYAHFNSDNAHKYLQQASKGFEQAEFVRIAKESDDIINTKLIETLERLK